MTDERDLEELQQFAGMGDESVQAMPPPRYGVLTVSKVKLVGEGEEACLKIMKRADERAADLVDEVTDERAVDLIMKRAELKPGTHLSVQEQAELESVTVQQSVLSGPELISVLNKFIALDGKNNRAYMRFAERFGFLGLCNKHGLPYRHPKWERWECGPDHYIERLVHWRWLVKWVETTVRIAALLRENREHALENPDFGRQEQWQALDVDARGLELCMIPPRNQEDAEGFLEKYVNYGLSWGEVRPFLDWAGPAPTVGFQGHTLWDQVVKQLLFRIAGGDSLCEICNEPREKGSRKFCKDHQGRQADTIRKRKSRARNKVKSLQSC